MSGAASGWPQVVSGRSAVAGFSIIELLIAATCTALIAAGVLSLMIGSTRSGRRLLAEAEIRGLARAAAATIAEDLERAGRGAEGIRSVQENGSAEPPIVPVLGGLVRILLPLAESVEVEPLAGGGRYRMATRVGLRPGARVLGLGLTRGRPAAAGIIGRVRSSPPAGRGPTPRTGVVEVAWAAAEAAAIAATGEVRGLLPVAWREYALISRDGGLQLRRRDEDGYWQPVVDGLLGLAIDYLVDHDDDGRPDGGLVPLPPEASRILGARIRAEAVLGEWDPVVVERWVRVGG